MDSRDRERKYTERAAREARKADAAYLRVERQIKLVAREQQRIQRALPKEAQKLLRLQKDVQRSQQKTEEIAKRAAREARKAVAAERKKRPLLPTPTSDEVRDRWEERRRREAS